MPHVSGQNRFRTSALAHALSPCCTARDTIKIQPYVDMSSHLSYVGNRVSLQPAASPATGYLKKHLAQQKEIIEKVLS